MKYLKPMLATLADSAFDSDEWTFEIKWDGYRAITYVADGKVEIRSRNNQLLNQSFPEIELGLSHVKVDLIIDGEIAVLDQRGVSQFELIQNYAKNREGVLRYFVFDLLSYNSTYLFSVPLTKRTQMLKEIIKESDIIKISKSFDNYGIKFFEEIKKLGIEGIVAKKKESKYYPGKRTNEWLKIKSHNAQEFVIGGFTDPGGSQKYFGALLIGFYEGKDFIYAGKVGSGFDEKTLYNLYLKMKKLETENLLFKNDLEKTNKKIHAVLPELVCQIKFREWTGKNLLRQPVFVGLRDDINPKEVKRELT